jgi:hypothetical protein
MFLACCSRLLSVKQNIKVCRKFKWFIRQYDDPIHALRQTQGSVAAARRGMLMPCTYFSCLISNLSYITNVSRRWANITNLIPVPPHTLNPTPTSHLAVWLKGDTSTFCTHQSSRTPWMPLQRRYLRLPLCTTSKRATVNCPATMTSPRSRTSLSSKYPEPQLAHGISQLPALGDVYHIDS